MTMQTRVSKDIDAAVRLLSAGDLVAVPTETVYGLAGNALDKNALLKIYETKHRPSFDPLIMHVASLEQASRYVRHIPDAYYLLAEKFSPGPLTYIFDKNELVPSLVTSGLPTVAIRIPNQPLTLELLLRLDFPLAAPSANLFGRISPTTPHHVLKQLKGSIPMILDGGKCSLGVESTIVHFSEGKLQVLRFGSTSPDQLKEVFKGSIVTPENNSIVAPGQLKSHYSPAIPLYFGKVADLVRQYKDKKITLITFSGKHHYPGIVNLPLTLNEDMAEAARNLFSTMYEAENSGADLIIAEKLPEFGLGLAINDRLRRASAND